MLAPPIPLDMDWRRNSCTTSLGSRREWVWSQDGILWTSHQMVRVPRKPPRRLPLPNMAARAPSAQPLSMDRPGSIKNRQLSGVQTPPTNEEGQRGAVGLGSGARGPMNVRHMGGRGGHPPMGSSGLCSRPPSTRRRTAPGAVHSRGGGGGGDCRGGCGLRAGWR